MVKGVSKTVIVVNNTGSKLFEKIVFYVTPEYGNLSAKQLKKAASGYSFHYAEGYVPGKLRKSGLKKRRRLILLAASLLLSAVALTVLLVIL